MKFGKLLTIIAVGTVISVGSLAAQPRQLNIERENSEFIDLQTTEAQQEKNIKSTYDSLGELGWLVEMVKIDRKTHQEQSTEEGRLDFKKSFRFVKYTPRNTYVRYVKESDDFLLTQFGAVSEVKDLVAQEIARAKAVGVATKDLNLQTRDGIELTQFNFIYGFNGKQEVATGSKRKSVSLYFTPKANPKPGSDDNWELSLVVSVVIKENYQEGIRNVEMIIDTSPQDEPMDDVLVFHRYNQKPAEITVLGSMSNTPTNPHRVSFKQKFYAKHIDHFFRLYRLVGNYASKDSNENNEIEINRLRGELDY